MNMTEMIYELVRKHLELEAKIKHLTDAMANALVSIEDRLLKREGRDFWDESKTFK